MYNKGSRRQEGKEREAQNSVEQRHEETQRLSLITGDTNDPERLGLHSMKLRKMRGGSTSPEGRAVLHQAVVESFVCGQELSCATEGLCSTEDTE